MIPDIVIFSKKFLALYGHAKPLQKGLSENEEVAIAFKKILALAFLPAGQIADAFGRITTDLSDEAFIIMQDFIGYYDRFWLKVVTPEGFSVYGIQKRTNNMSESLNSRLVDIFGIRPAAMFFLSNYYPSLIRRNYNPSLL